jgi:hypothetical protein
MRSRGSSHLITHSISVLLLLLTPQHLVAENPMDCVSELAIPYPVGQMMTSIPATVHVHVTIGRNGLASAVDYGDTKPILKIALDQYFKEESRYVPVCEGKAISFTLRYLVEGTPTPYPLSKVRFHPPNEFVIVAHPIEPSFDPLRR